MTTENPAVHPAESLVPADKRFQNFHLSVSRLKRFEQCPLAFKLHYIDELRGETSIPAAFGSMLHDALERLFGWVVAEEYSGRLPEDKLLEFYRDAWTASGLSGAPLYQEGLTILRSYCRSHPDVDAYQILACEQEFNLPLDEFTINGFIDRVDRVDDETIAIVDYKSNRLLFTREEVDTDLQMSVYALAARMLWPWAKKVRFVFHMLRHGVELITERSLEQLDDAHSYILATGRQTERATVFPARINTNCTYCDHRALCSAYADAVVRGDEIVATSTEDLDAVAIARERMHHVIKILDGRKRALEAIIRAQLEHADQVTLGGCVYKLVPWSSSTTHPVEDTLRLLGSLRNEEGLPAFDEAEIRKAVLTVDGKALKKFLEDAVAKVPRAKLLLVELEIDSLATKTPGAPRLHATTLKGGTKPELAEPPPRPALPAAPPVEGQEERNPAFDELVDPAAAAATTSADPPAGAPPGPSAPAAAPKAKREPKTKAPVVAARPGAEPFTPRKKKTRRPWQCPCGFSGFGRAVAEHRKVCPQAPPKGERTQAQGGDEDESESAEDT